MGDDTGAAQRMTLEQAPSPALETLMVRYQSGDRQAADALIERVSPALYRFLADTRGRPPARR